MKYVQRALLQRGAFKYLALMTLGLMLLSGFLATILDRRDFKSLEDGIWWSVQTVSTVGYGDIVPTTFWGRVLGTFSIVFGMTFLAFLTATVTSLFLSNEQNRGPAHIERTADGNETAASLARIEARLAAIEAKLNSDLP